MSLDKKELTLITDILLWEILEQQKLSNVIAKKSNEELQEVNIKLSVIIHEIRKINKFIEKPTKAEIIFGKGDSMSAAAVSLNIGQSVPVSLVQTRADGSVYTPNKGDVVLSMQDPTIASVVDNGDGTGTITAVAAGTTQAGGADQVTGLSAQGTVTVTGGTTNPPTSASIVFGTPSGGSGSPSPTPLVK